ncbi:MAG: MATE family efflux transporter [Clostridia bacterium]|nr:MATE family efflux transporter [Clostridia bacterium]
MGTMPLNKLLVTTSLPMVISMLVQALYNIVDSVFVSRIDEASLTALSYAFSMQNLMISICAGTGVGIMALLSKSLGEKNFHAANRAANNAIVLYLITYLVFLLIGLFTTIWFFRIQTNSPEIIEAGTQYLSICLIFSFGMCLQFCFDRMLMATGRTLYTMITQLVGAVTNIILDPILIFGLLGAPKLGMRGAAIATVIGQVLAATLSFVFNMVVNKDVRLHFADMRLKGSIVGRIYQVGVPSIIMMSIGSFMVMGMNQILNRFSETAVAVFGVYFKLQSFVFMPIIGLNNGMVPIIAYNYGARQKERIYGTMKLTIAYAVSIMLIGLILFETIPGQLLSIFDAPALMLTIGIPAIRIIAIHFPIAGVSIILSSTFQALGNGVYSLLVSLIRQIVALLPIAYFMSLTGNIDLVWLAFPLAEIVSVTTCLIFWRQIKRKKLNW